MIGEQKKELFIDPIARRQFVSLLKTLQSTKAIYRNNPEQTLLACFETAIQKYYKSGIKRFQPNADIKTDEFALRQRLIVRKLSEEWTRLLPVVTGMQVMIGDQELTDAVRNVVNCAWGMLNAEVATEKEIMILTHYGRHFELVTYRYTPHIAILGIPITSLYSPWDWTMIWHEIAGIYIQSEKANNLITHLDNMLSDNWWEQCLTTYQNETGHLPLEDGQKKPKEGVRRGWLAELVEDAFGILCLGRTMADSLADILTRYYKVNQPDRPSPLASLPLPLADFANQLTEEQQITFQEIIKDLIPDQNGGGDLRHPPNKLRVLVAGYLADLMGNKEITDASPESVLAQLVFAHKENIILEQTGSVNIESVNGSENKRDAWQLIPELLRLVNQSYHQEESTDDTEGGLVAKLLGLREENRSNILSEVREDKIRQLIKTRLKQHGKPRLKTQRGCTTDDIFPDLDDEAYNEWDSFYNYEMSSVDFGQATYVGEAFNIWRQRWIVSYTFSSVYCPTHAIYLNGSATTSHS